MTKRKQYVVWIWLVIALAACGAPGAPASPTPSTPPTSPSPDATADADTRPADGEQPENSMLDGTSWTLAELNGNPTVEGSTVTLSFANGTEFSGDGGCNSYGGTYTTTDGAIAFGDVIGTLRACAESGVTEQEAAYFQALRDAALYRVVDGRLEIQNAADATTLVFRSAAGTDPTPTALGDEQQGSTELDGSAWQLVALNDQPPAEGTTITLRFSNGNTFGGSAGCNQYGGTYTAAADGTWTFGPTANTEMACPEPPGVMEQETVFLDTLRRIARHQTINGQLHLLDAAGTALLVFAQPPAAVDPALNGGWELVALNGQPLVANTRITVEFSDDGIGGFAGCNSYGGSWQNGGTWVMNGGVLVLPLMAVTAVGCMTPAGVLEQESAYVDALAAAAAYTVAGAQLDIKNAAGETTLVFRREEPITNNPADLIGTRWRLRSIDGEPLLPDAIFTLIFDNATDARGQAECREYKATYEATADDLYFPTTEMIGEECLRPRLLAEHTDNFPEIIGSGVRYRFNTDQLELLPVNGGALVFEPLQEDAVTTPKQTIWTLEAFVEGDVTTPVLPDTTITLQFEGDTLREQGNVFGSAGCNRYRAAYTYGDRLTIKQGAATRMACAPHVMEQETRFLRLLEQITMYRLDDKLRLETTDGAALVFVVQSS